MQEEILIEKCKSRSARAQRVLFDSYYSSVYNLVRRYIRDRHEAEDVVMMAFNKVLKNIHRFQYRGDGSLRKWIHTISINESLRFLSKKKRMSYFDDLSYAESISESEVDIEIHGVSAEEIYLILEEMPDGYRTIFNLHAIEGFTHKQISEMLPISRNTSKSQMLKARRFILKKLKAKDLWEIN